MKIIVAALIAALLFVACGSDETKQDLGIQTREEQPTLREVGDFCLTHKGTKDIDYDGYSVTYTILCNDGIVGQM